MSELVRVAVPVILDRDFSYRVPADSLPVVPGQRVWVPFGSRVLVGIVRPGAATLPAGVKARALLGTLDDGGTAALPRDVVDLCEWIQDYYLAPPGEVYRLALPGILTTADARVLQLTAAGRDRLEFESLGPLLTQGRDFDDRPCSAPALELLAELARGERSGVALSTLMAGKARRHATHACIGELQALGFVDVRWADDPTAEKTELHVRRSAHLRGPEVSEAQIAELVGRSKQRRSILDWLDTQPQDRWIPLSDLRSPFPRARQQLKALLEAGLVESSERVLARDTFDTGPVELETPPEPTPEQAHAIDVLRGAAARGEFASFLLYGITGSGKTEVYLRVIERSLESGGTAIVLVPEIALTPQLADRFRARFGARVSVLHSGLSPKQRLDAWEAIRDGRCSIAIGPRSAVFAPIPNLRVIVVDEEHDASFKQEEGVRYHARDVALVRARTSGAIVILGSATPSLESWKLASEGRHHKIELKQRASGRGLPPIEVLDLRVHKPDENSLMSARLRDDLRRAVADGGQAMLFLNRRGYASGMRCKSCGIMPQCPDCSATSMTHHRGRNRMVCHLCGHIEDVPRRCRACGHDALQLMAAGTERIEQGLNAALSGLRVIRLDRDTSRGRRLLEVLNAFRSGAADVLVGTQMLSKGHDFPGVTLVGVLQGDQGLEMPDPRAAERVFQLLTQVAGRAGRAEKAGRVLVQAWSTEIHPIPLAARHDYAGFVQLESEARRSFGNPPYGYLAMLRIAGRDAGKTRARSEELAEAVRVALRGQRARASSGPEVQMLGPVASPMEKINQRWRWQILLRAPARPPLRAILRRVRVTLGSKGHGDEQTLAVADVDPFSFD